MASATSELEQLSKHLSEVQNTAFTNSLTRDPVFLVLQFIFRDFEIDVMKFMPVVLRISYVDWYTLVQRGELDQDGARKLANKLRVASRRLKRLTQKLENLSTLQFPADVGIDKAVEEVSGNVLASMGLLTGYHSVLTEGEFFRVKKDWVDIDAMVNDMFELFDDSQTEIVVQKRVYTLVNREPLEPQPACPTSYSDADGGCMEQFILDTLSSVQSPLLLIDLAIGPLLMIQAVEQAQPRDTGACKAASWGMQEYSSRI